ncbi:MAG: hypothetical protein KDB80_08650, partial [Planctomycetes bacterium]|nr:hypothetical protein [Planctomycetota bacterium]
MHRTAITFGSLALLAGCGGGGSSSSAQVSGFAIESAQQSLAANSGTRHQVALMVNTAIDFEEPITLSVDGNNSTVHASVTPANLTSGPGTLTIDVDPSATPGSHVITVVGRSPSYTRTRNVTIHTVDGATSAGLTLSVPPRLALRPGQSTAAMLEITRETGAIGDVTLTLAPLPGGPTASFDATVTPLDSSTLNVTAGGGVVPGTYPVSITANAGSRSGSTSCLVEVVDPDADIDRWISRVEFAQSYFAGDLEFVRGRAVFARVHVLADRAGTPSPRVELVGSSGGSEVGRLNLNGPATLPTGEDPGTLSQSFTAEIPASWVQPGLQLAFELDPDGASVDRDPTNDTATHTPRIGGGPDIDVVVVPLVVNGRTALPSTFDEALFAYWPVESVNLTVRAPYTITSVSDVSANGDGWSSVLSEVAALRASDGSSAYYYGAIDLSYNSGVFGLGYVGFPASVGADHSISTMVHEIGHNFGLSHAPCGGAAGTDPQYPHAGGIIGRWGYDRRSGQLQSPSTRNDVMGYCGWKWVSAFHYEKVRDRIDTGADIAPLVLASPEPLVTIEGWLADDGTVLLDRPRRSVGQKPTPGAAAATHELRLTFLGQTETHPITVLSLGCGATDPRGKRFSITLPDRGSLSRVELWSEGVRL